MVPYTHTKTNNTQAKTTLNNIQKRSSYFNIRATGWDRMSNGSFRVSQMWNSNKIRMPKCIDGGGHQIRCQMMDHIINYITSALNVKS